MNPAALEARRSAARAIAEVWLAGPWTLEGMESRLLRMLARDRLPRSLRFLAEGFYLELRDQPHERRLAPLAEAIAVHAAFQRIGPKVTRCRRVFDPPVMAAAPGDWDVPPLPTGASIAAWLGVAAPELEWLADRLAVAGHYRRYWRGGRLIEAPGRRLARAQRQILDGLLSRVPPHDAAHGFRRSRSVRTAVEPHVKQPCLLVMDLRAFFPSVRASRVHALLQRAGYPEGAARMLTRLCTTRCRVLPAADRVVDLAVLDHYRRRHLPQGAPTSPALANLVAYHLDARLTGFARSVGARYTRYADDLIFSGPVALRRAAFAGLVTRIVRDEGFAVNPKKTRAMGQGARQQVLGIVVNERPTLPRAEFDKLEAMLFDCVRRGPGLALGGRQRDPRARLVGRVAWARQVDPVRAARLEELLGAIDWRA